MPKAVHWHVAAPRERSRTAYASEDIARFVASTTPAPDGRPPRVVPCTERACMVLDRQDVVPGLRD